MSLELLPLTLAGVRAFTSTRAGGVSEGPYASLNLGLNTGDEPARVLENRSRLWADAGFAERRTVFMQQVHGQGLRLAGPADGGRGSKALADALPACDLMITREKGLGLAVGHADCLALVVADPVAGALGVAHAGWRGALLGVAGQLVRALAKELGAKTASMVAGLSVCLGPDHLELSEEQHRLFRAADPGLGDYCSPLVKGHFKLDLWSCCRKQLEAEGLRSEAIVEQRLSTAAEPKRFFSHRRDQGKTGRMLTLAQIIS